MFIQGDIQVVFDALYSLGVIDPVLKSDWTMTEKEMQKKRAKVRDIISSVNQCNNSFAEILKVLSAFDQEALSFLALEVARELAESQSRKTLH